MAGSRGSNKRNFKAGSIILSTQLKAQDIDSDTTEEFTSFKKEAQLLAGLDCQYLIHLFGVTPPPSAAMILEVIKSNLLNAITLQVGATRRPSSSAEQADRNFIPK